MPLSLTFQLTTLIGTRATVSAPLLIVFVGIEYGSGGVIRTLHFLCAILVVVAHHETPHNCAAIGPLEPTTSIDSLVILVKLSERLPFL